jgi:pimeloyl-ACP methyl ester carboxylesterase
MQPALFYVPESGGPAPLLVGLHTWSGDYMQPESIPYARWAIKNKWAFIHPELRGPNDKPEATGSALVLADLVSAVEYAKANARIDPDRIYLVGCSGGGYTALLAAGKFPDLWAGVSAWSSITDLKAWFHQSKQRNTPYSENIADSCGGPPGKSLEVDFQYRVRSPLKHIGHLSALPVDINAGIRDGHDGSVPVSHSLKAFNILALPEDRLDDADIEYFVQKAGVPEHLKNEVSDGAYGEKRPLFRRLSGNTRITIFDGGHEIIYEAALTWLEAQKRTCAQRP